MKNLYGEKNEFKKLKMELIPKRQSKKEITPSQKDSTTNSKKESSQNINSYWDNIHEFSHELM